jgi:MFS family permease
VGSVEDEASRRLLTTLLVLTFTMNMIARGVTETFAVFLLPVQEGLGVSRPEITLTYSVFMLAYGAFAPLAGQLIDRFGARVAYSFGLVSLGCGYVLAGSATKLWQYLFAAGLLGGLGSASLGMIAASALLSRWFTNRIGTVMSIPYAAIGGGMLILPPLTQLLVTSTDWRTAHWVLGGGVLAVLPFLFFAPLKRITAGSPEWQALRRNAANPDTGPWNETTAIHTAAYWG